MQDRAQSFDTVADLYDEMRPRYPAALYDDLLAISQAPPGAEVLEVGTGPGVATRPLAQRGLRIVGLEPGPTLAAVARINLAEFDSVEIRQATFEEAELDPESFDLVVSASAWHWVDPAVGLTKAARILRPGGSLAVWWGHGDLVDPEVAAAVTEVSERRAPGVEGRRQGGGGGRRRRADLAAQVADSTEFGSVERRPHPFELTYDAQGFVSLLDTYSHYRLLDPTVREGLFEELIELVDSRFGGQVTRRYLAELMVTRRLDPSGRS